MPSDRAYLHDCALSLIGIAALGLAWQGAALAGSVLTAGSLLLAHLLVLQRSSVAFMREGAGGGAPSVMAFAMRPLLLLPLGLVLVASVGADAVLLALCAIPIGALVASTVGRLQLHDAARVSVEVPC